jgi:hypothetical protein
MLIDLHSFLCVAVRNYPKELGKHIVPGDEWLC